LTNLVSSDKTTIPGILTGEVKIDKPDSPDQRRFDFQQATKVVEEQKKIEKLWRVEKEHKLLDLSIEEEKRLINEIKSLQRTLDAVRGLIKIYRDL
jgi:hypothetical protein